MYRPLESITRQALSWNPQGKQKKSRPRSIWRHEMESEIKRTRRTWKDLERTALDRRAWKDVAIDLCLLGAKRWKIICVYDVEFVRAFFKFRH
jgi:hypothetical protein